MLPNTLSLIRKQLAVIARSFTTKQSRETNPELFSYSVVTSCNVEFGRTAQTPKPTLLVRTLCVRMRREKSLSWRHRRTSHPYHRITIDMQQTSNRQQRENAHNKLHIKHLSKHQKQTSFPINHLHQNWKIKLFRWEFHLYENNILTNKSRKLRL